jgi:hypothetical protein
MRRAALRAALGTRREENEMKRDVTAALAALVAALIILPTAFAVEVFHDSRIVFPIDTIAYVSCGNGGEGEEVHLVGEVVLTRTVIDADGRFIRFVTSSTSDLTGYGATSGHLYRQAGIVVQNQVYGLPSGGNAYHFTISVRLIEQGTGVVFTSFAYFTFVVDEDGTVRVEKSAYRSECGG